MKKINFEKIDEIASSDETLKKFKKEMRIWFLGSLIISMTCFYLLIKTDSIENEFLSLFVLLIAIYALVTCFRSFFNFFGSKNKAKVEMQLNLYKSDLPFLTLTPNNVKFEEVKLLIEKGKDKESIDDELVKQAFSYKADAIINYKYETETISSVKGNRKVVKTTHETIHMVQGVAIRLLD